MHICDKLLIIKCKIYILTKNYGQLGTKNW